MNHASGNFVYDERGRMTEDRQAGKVITYGFYSNRPVSITITKPSNPNQNRTFHMLYSESMIRVAEIEEKPDSGVIGSKVELAPGI